MSSSSAASPSWRSSAALQERPRARHHDRVVLDREDRAVLVVERRAGDLADLARLAPFDQLVELVPVLDLERRHEAVVAVAEERAHPRGSDDERIAEQRLDVAVEIEPADGALELRLDERLDLLVEGKLADDLVQRLELIALEVRLDRDGERRLLGQVAERRIERAAAVAAATTEADGEQARRQGEQTTGERRPHGASESRGSPCPHPLHRYHRSASAR